MNQVSSSQSFKRSKGDWLKELRPFAVSDHQRSIWQLLNTFIPYVLLWGLLIFTVKSGYPVWVTLLLTIPAAGLLIRIFIFFHDCGHGSFFNSKTANTILGTLSGILTFTPYEDWRRSHARHHLTVADLDRRGEGDVYTMTRAEFEDAPFITRLGYRLMRHPLIMFVLGPVFVFLIGPRFAHKGAGKEARRSVWITNLALLLIFLLAWQTIGIGTYVLIQLPIIWLAGMAGIWLFYVQHQFEGVYWARHEEWDPVDASLKGSSFYKLPAFLQWFSGSIGFHHIHHIHPGIPNYNLQTVSETYPELQETQPLTLMSSLRCMNLDLYDEDTKEMISFNSLRKTSA